MIIIIIIRQDSNSQTFSQRNFDEKQVRCLKELETGVPQKEVALRFGMQKSTLSTWKRNKTKIEEAYHAGLGNKRMRPEKYEDLNKALMEWFLNCRSENIPLNGPLLKEKANFQASDGCWRNRRKGSYTSFYFFSQHLV